MLPLHIKFFIICVTIFVPFFDENFKFHSWFIDNVDWVRLELPTIISKVFSCLKIYPFGWKSILSSEYSNINIIKFK